MRFPDKVGKKVLVEKPRDSSSPDKIGVLRMTMLCRVFQNDGGEQIPVQARNDILRVMLN